MRKIYWVAALLIVVAAVGWWLAGDRDKPTAPVTKATTSAVSPGVKGQPPAPPVTPQRSSSSPPVPAPAKEAAGTPTPATAPGPAPKPFVPPRPPPLPDDPAKEEAESLALNIRHFGQRFGGNPVGTNAEIVKALMGGNAAGATYLPSELQRLNDKGELIDQWGTPYFFHQNSATDMEVRSAGPDKILHNADDIVTK
jgi:hypothetical protein